MTGDDHIPPIPPLRYGIPVPVTRKAYNSFLDLLNQADYPVVLERGSTTETVWVLGVCVAERYTGGQSVYPANFARYTDRVPDGWRGNDEPAVPP